MRSAAANGALLLAIAGSLLAWHFYPIWSGSAAAAKTAARQAVQGPLRNGIQAIESWSARDTASFAAALVDGKTYLGPELYAVMQSVRPDERTAAVLEHGRAMTDKWGQPLRFQFTAPVGTNGDWEVLAWSCGPNGIDEHGQGDDVAVCDTIVPWHSLPTPPRKQPNP